MKPVFVAATLALLALTDKGVAHEFWIDPEAYVISPGETLSATLRVGQEFSGAAMSYLPRNFETFIVRIDGETREVEGRFGDLPALSMAEMDEGLAVIVHQTTVRDLEWSDRRRLVQDRRPARRTRPN